MKTHFVRLLVDIHCRWHGEPPVYRCYVGGELFCERQWVWQDAYLEEALQIEAPAGKYEVKFDFVGKDAEFKLKNMRVDYGPGKVHKHDILEIVNENT